MHVGEHPRVERLEELVQRHVPRDARRRELPALRDRRGVATSGSDLDVGLAEQRLGAQDRRGAGTDWDEARLDLDHRVSVVAGADDAGHAADIDPRDLHVLARNQCPRVRKRHGDGVGSGGERPCAAEGPVEAQQQRDAGQGEARQGEHASGRGELGSHRLSLADVAAEDLLEHGGLVESRAIGEDRRPHDRTMGIAG